MEEYIVRSRQKFGINSDIVRHLEPQVNFLFDEKMEKILIDKVIKINEIETMFQSLKNHIGFSNLELKKENVSQSKEWIRSDLSQSDSDFLKKIYEMDYKFIANLEK